MKNKLLEAQLRNIENTMQALKTACHLAALEDDGKVGFMERRRLQKIEKATDRFLKDIKGIYE